MVHLTLIETLRFRKKKVIRN